MPHLHLAINRVHPETLRAWNRWHDRPRIEAALRRVEREWGLRRVPGRSAEVERQGKDGRPSLSTGQKAQLRYRAKEPQVARWQRELAPHFEAARSWSDLAVRLEANGFRFQARGRGMVVTDGEVYAKASSIGREYSRGKLEARFGQGLAEWTKSRERFDAAAGLYARYGHRGADHPRAQKALRALRSAGSALGWKAAARLSGPLAPVVGAVAVAAVRQRMNGNSAEAAWADFLRRRVAPALEKSNSWAEVEGRLGLRGMWIERARSEGGDLVVTDGVRSHSLQRLGEAGREERLRGRLGSWETWQEQRRDVLAHARRLQRFEATVDERRERWHRMIAAAHRVELRVERYETLQADYQMVADRLRTLIELHGPKKMSHAEREWRLEALGTAPESQLPALLGQMKGLFRRQPTQVPEDARETLRAYRQIGQQLAQEAPAVQIAQRRLPRLRRRAGLLSPREGREAIQRKLSWAVRKLERVGAASLVAREAPGLGSLASLVRVVRRLHERQREMARGGR